MYINADIAERHGAIGKIKVFHNGIEIKEATEAKCGKNGFVKFAPLPIRVKNDEIVYKKIRGNIKISFNLNKNNA